VGRPSVVSPFLLLTPLSLFFTFAQVFESDGSAAKDYILERKCLNGSVLNVRNAPSPACTASLAIAEHVVNIAQGDFGWKA
jgi:hypothetical protein